jgi:DUF1707 SHOCT-like domain
VTTGPQDPAVAGHDRLRAGHADRDRALETLKDAFVHGRLTKEEFDARAGRALIARTGADLAALTADIPSGSVPARPVRPASPARRWPLARAAVGSGICLVIAAAAARAVSLADPGPPGPTPYHSFAPLCMAVAVLAALMALAIFGSGVAASIEQRQSRRDFRSSINN